MLTICDLVFVLREFNVIGKMHDLYHTMSKLFTLIIYRINYFLQSYNEDAVNNIGTINKTTCVHEC
jgi:hypothetical protein